MLARPTYSLTLAVWLSLVASYLPTERGRPHLAIPPVLLIALTIT